MRTRTSTSRAGCPIWPSPVIILAVLSGMGMSISAMSALYAAGITLVRSDPGVVADALDISRRTYRKIR